MSGSAELSRQLRKLGYRGVEYDREAHHSDEDIISLQGMIWATLLALSVERWGLNTLAPKCSSWGRAAVHTMGREQNNLTVVGLDEERPDVMEANAVADCVGFLMVLSACRQVYCWLEQPQGSSLCRYPSIWFALGALGAEVPVHTWQGGFGHATPKPTYMWTSLPASVHPLLRARKPAPRERAPEEQFHRRSGRWWHGTALLTSSEAYPPQFAAAIAQAFQQARCL